MPFDSGSAETPSILLRKLNTFLTANGWTRRRGELDVNCASPKAARYWRIQMINRNGSGNANSFGVQLVHLRETPGGPNLATVGANWSSDATPTTGTLPLLVSGGRVIRGDFNTNAPPSWSLVYDFGTPTIIREWYIRGDTFTGYSPDQFLLQWSNDGVTWTTMFKSPVGLTWTASEYKTFTIADGYIYPAHAGAALPSRSGARDSNSSYYVAGNGWEERSEDVWTWEAPGYDAARRVFISARPFHRLIEGSSSIEFTYHTSYDVSISNFYGQAGGGSNVSAFHAMNRSTVEYWFFCNNHRFIVVTQSGPADFTSSYVGFMGAFATPNDYPFPLLISSTSSTNPTDFAISNVSSMAPDPAYGAMICKDMFGNNRIGGNRDGSVDGFRASGQPDYPFVWPFHFGKATDNNSTFPGNAGSGGYNSVDQTMFSFIVPTAQSELPIFPAIVCDKGYGLLGVMTGIFAIPGGDILAAKQRLTIAGEDYIAFPNRTRRNRPSWMLIKEE